MKKLLLILSLVALPFLGHAQSVTIRVVANDGVNQTTNTVSLSADKVSGLVSSWNKDSQTKTNAGGTALTFGGFILQELGDKGAEWTLQAGKDAIKAAGVTNAIPDVAARRWFLMTAPQQTNVVNYLNTVSQ